jgi:xanthine/CO dehydrogenase XdhC/CoxF family maturation factor
MSEIARIAAPIGLDIGAQSPEEIAVAILAQIAALPNLAASPKIRRKPEPCCLARFHSTRPKAPCWRIRW